MHGFVSQLVEEIVAGLDAELVEQDLVGIYLLGLLVFEGLHVMVLSQILHHLLVGALQLRPVLDLVSMLAGDVEEPRVGEPASADGVGEGVAGVEKHSANGHSNVPWKVFQLVKDCSLRIQGYPFADSQNPAIGAFCGRTRARS